MSTLPQPIKLADIDHEVLVLIHHKTLTRDCWFETDQSGEKILIIRQIKFDLCGESATQVKQFRLSLEEARALLALIAKEGK